MSVSWRLEHPVPETWLDGWWGGEPTREHFYSSMLKQHSSGHLGLWACNFILAHHYECAIKGNLAATTVKCQMRAASFLADR